MENRKRFTKLIWALAVLMVTAGISQAAVITEWDQSNVTPMAPTNVANPGLVFDQYNYIEPGSLLDPNTGAVATGGFMPSGYSKYAGGINYLPNGAMTWKERDTQGPGLSIVTDDDTTHINCIMSAGWNPDSTPTATQMSDWWGVDKKQCSDPFQSSKRFKVVSYMIDAPIDLDFTVSANGADDIYRLLQKYGNQTGHRVSGYTQQLGFTVNGVFTEAQPGQGLAFTLKNGTKHSNDAPTPSTMANQGELDSLLAHGLFGAPDKHHTASGYFNPNVRASFGVEAGETFIRTTGMAPVHTDLFGEWMPSQQPKGAYYFDMDGIVYTDNALVASCEGAFDAAAGQADPVNTNAGCDGTWVTYRSSYVPVQNADGTYTIPTSYGIDPTNRDLNRTEIDSATLAAWAADSLWIPGNIDDFANVNINAYIAVGNAANWPTADTDGNASFTIRMTPTFDLATATTEPGTDGPADFIVSIDAPTTVVK
ncbi:choice-of-anchor F family protein [Geopsychrobacter electrodiphilus]|uniref:choice-of-anchor F family protein n=1 Tax=Geopsychrobacter electrodiphilus TaxID=225196 RepID=UPI000381A499|nr:choice-of-anchor F family protein [Geopsychrobacter electrodiphilus]